MQAIDGIPIVEPLKKNENKQISMTVLWLA